MDLTNIAKTEDFNVDVTTANMVLFDMDSPYKTEEEFVEHAVKLGFSVKDGKYLNISRKDGLLYCPEEIVFFKAPYIQKVIAERIPFLKDYKFDQEVVQLLGNRIYHIEKYVDGNVFKDKYTLTYLTKLYSEAYGREFKKEDVLIAAICGFCEYKKVKKDFYLNLPRGEYY